MTSSPPGIRWASAAEDSPIRGRSSKTSTAAEPLAEDADRPAGGVHGGGRQLQQRGLAGPVGPEHHPALVLLDRPVDRVQQQLVAAPDRDRCQLQDRVRVDVRSLRSLSHRRPSNSLSNTRSWQHRASRSVSVRCADDGTSSGPHPVAGAPARLAGAASRCGPGPVSPFPLGAGWDGEGTNFSIWSPPGHQGRGLPVRLARRRAPGRAGRAELSHLARLPARHQPRPALRLPDHRPGRSPVRASATTRPSC